MEQSVRPTNEITEEEPHSGITVENRSVLKQVMVILGTKESRLFDLTCSAFFFVHGKYGTPSAALRSFHLHRTDTVVPAGPDFIMLLVVRRLVSTRDSETVSNLTSPNGIVNCFLLITFRKVR